MNARSLLLTGLLCGAVTVAGCGSADDPSAGPVAAKPTDASPPAPFVTQETFNPDNIPVYRSDEILAKVSNVVVAGTGAPIEKVTRACHGAVASGPSEIYVPAGHYDKPYQYWICQPR
jgi:hypothetical protein